MSIKKDLSLYNFRKEQTDAIDFIDSEYKSNVLNKFFLLNLPTGIGKSHLAIMIADWYMKNVNRTARIDIITNSKLVQNQYDSTYSSINDLKGKENYECSKYSCSCAQGAEFNRLNNTTCDICPYKDARESYMSGTISLTNFYLYILFAMYKPNILESRNARVLIVDECHEFDDVMSDFITIKITASFLKKYGFQNSTEILKQLSKIKNVDQYSEFIKEFTGEINETIQGIESQLSSKPRTPIGDKRNSKMSKLLKTKSSDIKNMQMINDLKQLITKIEIFLKEYKLRPENWVLESTYNEKTKQKDISLEPLWANEYLSKYIFDRYDMVFMMSGTILDKDLFCYLNGLEADRAVFYSIDSPFDRKNRPIYYMPIGKMSYNKKEETFKRYIPYIEKILEKYSDRKGVIHTNSFELSNWIMSSIKNPRLVTHGPSDKDEVLRMHISSKEPTVIVSPSMDTGVSFDNDLARFQIIAKIPYPSLASQKNKIRQKQNPQWYSWKTSCSLQQACGRIVRSNLDWGDTIIIDESFGDVIKWSSDLIPDWMQESIKKINIKR
jgi:ATP-dependent DNA helicase DinG